MDAPPAAPDLLELRLDHFAGRPEALDTLEALAAESPRASIVTVRHPDEGGEGNLDADSRRMLYARFLPAAHCVDLELRSLDELAAIAEQARGTPGGLIASYHDFHAGPDLARLRALASQAAAAGAALFKVAVRVEEAAEVAVLLDFLTQETPLPLAVMGMGRLGRISRLAAAALGSRLNYGFLGEVAQVPGQWPAALLRARLDELGQNAAAHAGRTIFGHPSSPGQRIGS